MRKAKAHSGLSCRKRERKNDKYTAVFVWKVIGTEEILQKITGLGPS